MNHHSGVLNLRRIAVAAFALILAFTFTLAVAANSADARKKGKKAKVTLKVTTKNQKALLKAGKLTVRVKSTAKTRVRVTATQAGKSNRFKARTVRFKKRGTKRIKLKLTKAGRNNLKKCGAKTVVVKGVYKKGKKKAKTKRKKRLAKDATRCVKPTPPQPNYVTVPLGDDPEHCDFLDTTVCLQPWPNDYYTKNAATPTGKQLDLAPTATPKNDGNPNPKNLEVGPINRSDGFSPGNLITLKVPGLDTPAAFENSNLVPLTNISEYKDAAQGVVVIDAETGERHPIWAELDSNPTSVDPEYGPDGPDPDDDPDVIDPGGINENPGNTGPVNIIVRPAENFEFGKRYIVAFRNLKNAENQAIESPLGFRVYRDNLPTQQNVVEQRRPHMEQIINDLSSKAGIAKEGLYMAWDFTVASEENVTGRATDIRDAAFAELGDTNLADRKIQGDSPEVDVLAYCDKSNTASPQCGNNYPGNTSFPIPQFNPANPVTSPVPGTQEQRTVVGYIRNVPCFLDENGCPPGSEFRFNADGSVDTNTNFTVDVPFRCLIPMSVVNTGAVVPGGTGTYGHGLLGTLNQINATRAAANSTNSSWCAANWDGFSNHDIGPVIIPSLGDMSNFHKATDRMQQGFLNFMFLQRAMAHPDGFADEEAFTMTHNGNVDIPDGPAIDTSAGEDTRGYYYGISQGGIMGGALTALSPDVDMGVLGVPGINYSTLLRRSVDSDQYFKMPGLGLYHNYPNQAERPLLLSLMQLLWDRGEGNGYAHNMTDDPLPNTNDHEVLLQMATGDHQVSNFAADVEARTIGALRYEPTLVPERHNWDMTYEALPPITSYPAGPDESFSVYYDSGPPTFEGTRGIGAGLSPLENVPPRPEWGFGRDPHGDPRESPDANAHIETFYESGTINQCADDEGYCFANGWDGETGLNP
jgi:hypothetical protein